jgi:hypothetical protein
MRKRRNRWIQLLSIVGLLLMVQPAQADSQDDWRIKVTPAENAKEVAPDTVITLTFSDNIRLKNNKEMTDKSLLSVVQLSDSKKKKVPFIAKWNKTNRTITVDPVGNLQAGQSYKMTLQEKKLKDGRGRLNPQVSVTFFTKTPVDNIAPQAIILPGHGAKQVKLQEKVTLQFAEEVMLVDGAILSSKTAGPLVRITDDKGAAVPHTITWNKSKRTLTVKPKGKWQPYTSYQIILVSGLLKDGAGNVNLAQASRFTTGDK